MGFVDNKHVSRIIPPTDMLKTAGTWTDTVGAVASTYMQRRTAANATFVLVIPICPPVQSENAGEGCLLESVEVNFEITTEAMDAVAAKIIRATRPADGAAYAAVEELAFSYDTGHDIAAERIDIDQHTMTLTLTTAVWLDDGHELYVELSGDGGVNGVFDIYSAKANFSIRL